MSDDLVTLTAKSVRYYTQHDEDIFFEWLKLIPSIVSVHGEHDTVYIQIRADLLTEHEFLEILTAFRRYGIDVRQLYQVERPHNRQWLRDKEVFWYPLLFGD